MVNFSCIRNGPHPHGLERRKKRSANFGLLKCFLSRSVYALFVTGGIMLFKWRAVFRKNIKLVHIFPEKSTNYSIKPNLFHNIPTFLSKYKNRHYFVIARYKLKMTYVNDDPENDN